MNKQQLRLGYIESAVSSVLNIVLFALKLWVGMASNSIAMVADAWHTLSDTLTSLVVMIGFWVSGKPSDREHPFGHGRAELIGALVVGVLLGIVGFNFLKDAVVALFRHQAHASYSVTALAIFGVSVVLKEALAQFAIWAGKKIDSKSLIGDGWHHRSDAIASALIVVGAIVGRSVWWIDSALGIGVSLLILWAAFDVVRGAADSLLGEQVDDGLLAQINDIISEVVPVTDRAHHLHIHRYGNHREITLHVTMPGQYTLDRAHILATEIEKNLRMNLDLETTVHMEPFRQPRSQQQQQPDTHDKQ